MIVFENVSFSYPNTPVLSNVNFTMKDVEFGGILGPNGGGKSTFLRLALGLLKPSRGKVEIKERKISYIAQTTSLSDSSFPATVEEVVSLGLVDERIRIPWKGKKKIEETLREMDLLPFRKRLISELSGGQLQRVKVAKAILSSPSLIVLDEPDAGMDEESHDHFVRLIENLHEKGIGVLFVSHHPHDLEKADTVYFIEQGQMLTYEHELERGHHHVDL